METFFLPFAAALPLFCQNTGTNKSGVSEAVRNKIIGAIRIIRANGARDKLSITILTSIYYHGVVDPRRKSNVIETQMKAARRRKRASDQEVARLDMYILVIDF